MLFVGLGLAYPFSATLQAAGARALRTFSIPLVVAKPMQDGCTVNCTGSAPATAEINQAAAFTATATPSGCVGAPTFQWDFGDNTGSAQQNPMHAYTTGGIYNWRLTVESMGPSTMANISTVAGGVGEGEAARDVSFGRLLAIARDPLNRGVYIVSAPDAADVSGRTRIIFLNTGTTPATVAGRVIAPGTIRTIAGGGLLNTENQPGPSIDVGTVTGIAVNPAGDLVYFTEQTGSRIRVINVSAAPVTVAGSPLATGLVRTFAQPMVMEVPVFGDLLYGLAYNPITNDLIVADATAGLGRVYKVHQDGTAELIAGNGAATRADDVFEGGLGTTIPLLDARSVEVDNVGAVLIADSGHGRVIRVASNGATTLVRQMQQGRGTEGSFPIGLAFTGTSTFVANGNEHQVLRITGIQAAIAGQFRETCDYSGSNCGDGASAAASTLLFPMTGSEIPLAGLEAETGGVYILDQSANQRGRVRFANISAAAIVKAGVTIPSGAIATIAGTGLAWPYDEGKAASASFRNPVGVVADANRNLYIADTLNARIRFVNRTGSTINLFQGTPAAQAVPPGAIATINYQGGGGPGETTPAHLAYFQNPQGLAKTNSGLYIVDTRLGPFIPPNFQGRITSLVRFLNTSSAPVVLFPNSESPITVPAGFVATIAGSDSTAASEGNGDGGFARNARFFGLSDVAIDSDGNIFVTEVGEKTVRRIDHATGIVSSLSLGEGTFTGLAFAPDGRLFVTDAAGGRLLRQNAPGSATFTQLANGLGSPRDVAVDVDGIAIVTNAIGHKLLSVAPNGTVATLAGSTQGFSGDGGPGTTAQLDLAGPNVSIGSGAQNQLAQTVGITVTASREIFFADVNNSRIRRLGADIITCTKTGTVSVNNPTPTLASITPIGGPTEGVEFTLTLTGTNFVGNSIVRFKGVDRETTYVSPTQIKAQIFPEDLATPGNAAVTVFNPGPGGGTSSSVNFVITNPAPTITLISPTNVLAASGALQLEIEGTDFLTTSVVRWNGVARPTTFINKGLLSINVPATDVLAAGTVNITVFTPTPGGGTTGALVFTINNPVPTLATISPDSADGGTAGFTLTVTGTNLVSSSVVRWSGQGLPTTFVSNTQLTATVSAANIASGGDRSVTIFNPSPGGGGSNALTFSVSNPAPTISSLTPSSASAGSNAFVITVSGTNLSPNSIVRWNDVARPTVFIDSTTVTATIPATDLAVPGAPVIKVVNPPPGGGTSNGLTFTITNPVPVFTSVEPNRIVAGSSDILITINGSKFFSGSIVRWNGQNRVTTFVSPTQLKVVLVASDLAVAGQGLLTVFNPAPEGGTSAALPFTVFPPNPNPVITSLSKTIAVNGSAGFLLTVKGANFIDISTVLWNGSPRTTTFVSATELSAAIPASDLQDPGVAQVSVTTPGPGGGTTNPLNFVIASPLTVVPAASFLQGPVSAGGIVAGFGVDLAVDVKLAETTPLPTLLLGSYISVTDSAGASRQAPLFFVSPNQINFLIPPQTATGLATIDVTSGDGKSARGTIQITPGSLSLFSASADGKGPAAANFVRVVGSAVTFENAAQFVENAWVPLCVDLGPASNEVYLALYGTGLNGNPAGLTLTATINGVATPVPFAGAQGTYVGLDQLNVGPIPRQLIGAKTVDVIVRVNGVPTNVVQICIN